MKAGCQMKIAGIFLFSILILINTVNNGKADHSFRCHGHIVSIGDTQMEVEDKCGEPYYIEEWEEGGPHLIVLNYDYKGEHYIAPRLIVGPVRMARWTYNLGSNRFIRYLQFQNGDLIKITTGDKGSG
jgi:hypothetical protein